MKNRWIAILGACLLGSVLGCGNSGQTVTVPDEGAPPPTTLPTSDAAPQADPGAAPKAP